MSLIAVNICLVGNGFEGAALPLSRSLCPGPDDTVSRQITTRSDDDDDGVDNDNDENDSHYENSTSFNINSSSNNSNNNNNNTNYNNSSSANYSDGSVWDASVSYRLESLAEKKLQRGLGHAHCTVAQLCVRATDLQTLKDTIRSIWQSYKEKAIPKKEMFVLSKIEEGPVFTTLRDGTEVRVPSIAIERSDMLMSLHTEVVAAVREYAVTLSSMDVAKSTFHKSFPVGDVATVKWMMDYLTVHSNENYHPHISLGASPIKSIEKLTFFQSTKVPWRECRLVVSHMGNYCSCFELLE